MLCISALWWAVNFVSVTYLTRSRFLPCSAFKLMPLKLARNTIIPDSSFDFLDNYRIFHFYRKWGQLDVQASSAPWQRRRAWVHSLFTVAGGITFIFLNHGRHWVQDMLFLCIASVLLPSTRLHGRLSTKYPHTVESSRQRVCYCPPPWHTLSITKQTTHLSPGYVVAHVHVRINFTEGRKLCTPAVGYILLMSCWEPWNS